MTLLLTKPVQSQHQSSTCNWRKKLRNNEPPAAAWCCPPPPWILAHNGNALVWQLAALGVAPWWRPTPWQGWRRRWRKPSRRWEFGYLQLRGGPDVEHLAELFLALMEDEGVMMRWLACTIPPRDQAVRVGWGWGNRLGRLCSKSPIVFN